MSFGEKTQNIKNIITVEVLILIQMMIIFPCTVSVYLSDTTAAEIGLRCGLRTADSDEHYCCRHSSTAQMGVSHTQCCLLMLMGGSVVTSCSLHVLLSTCG